MAPVGQYLRFATTFDEEANRRVLALAHRLAITKPFGVRDIYPGYGSAYVEWDDDVLPSDEARVWIDAGIATAANEPEAGRDVEMPVRYGGLDTAEVSAETGLAPEAIAELHAASVFRVCARGTAGQPMLGGTDPRLEIRRRATPRTDVPALSIAVAGRQGTIYPVTMPGGWSVIGTALERIYDPHLDDPFRFRLGDRVRFRAAEGEPPAAPTLRELLPAEPALPAFRVEQAGAFDLVVDAGRFNQAHRGLAQSGPVDARAARLANALCDNPPGAPLLECALTGPVLVALRPLVVGAAGDGLALDVDGDAAGWATTAVRPGQRLRLRATGRGMRGYLAVAGGIAAEPFLGSASVDRFALLGRALRAGDVLGLAAERVPARRLTATPRPVGDGPLVLRLHRGPQWTAAAEAALTSRPFAVETGDRMGIRLEGPEVPGGEILSESPPPGALQVTSGGAPILLLADRQRSAGYDKPAVLHPQDLALAGQLRRGDEVRFVVAGDHPVPWFRDLG